MKVIAGTSGFSFKEWIGSFYPNDLPADAMLAFYAERFPTVEINNTFYRLPKTALLAEWASQVPASFTFAIKASQRITHHARLKPECAGPLAFLLETTAALGSQLGPILFQLPPNLKKDTERLRSFLALLPDDRKFTIEFRHPTWFDDDVLGMLRARHIALCITEQPEFASPVIATASWGYVRLHRLDYTETELAEWATRLAGQPWTESYVYFKHDEGTGSGPPAVASFVGTFDRSSSG